MVPESPTEDLNSYCVIAKIQQIHVPILRGSLLNASLSTSMSLVIQTLLDCKSQGSVYIHCLDGRRITGLVVLLIRRMQGWAPGAAFAEYWRYQTVMRPPVSVFEMERVSKETVKFILDTIAMVRVSRREQEIPRWVNLAALLSECIVMDPLSGGIATPGSNGAIQSGNSTPNSTYPKQTQASTSGRVRATMGGAFSKRSPINIGDNDDDDEDDRIIGMQRHPQISTSNTSALSFKGSSQGNQLRRSSSLDFLLAELETDNATEKVNSIRSATLIPASNLTFKGTESYSCEQYYCGYEYLYICESITTMLSRLGMSAFILLKYEILY